MTTEEIHDEIIYQLSDNTSVRQGNGYCTWVISGRYIDSEGICREVEVTTHDEELATGWHEDRYDRQLYSTYQLRWAEYLADTLNLVNLY